MPKKLDLTGMIFGEWKVLEFSHRAKGHRYWECKCSCGNIKTVGTSSLTCGKSKSCHGYKNEIDWYINERNCWICTSHARSKDRYPKMRRNGKLISVSRHMYENYKGEIPVGYEMCHTCDTPACINPDHLFTGTHLDNIKDMIAKGRNVKGEKTKRNKLTEKEVYEIKFGCFDMSRKDIASKYGVDVQYVDRVGNGLRWAHVTK